MLTHSSRRIVRALPYCALSGLMITGCVFCTAHAETPGPAADRGSLIRLDNVVVSAAGHEQTVEEAPATISVIGRQELEKKGYKDLTDALVDIPGVVLTGSGSSTDISVRGMAPGYTMILVDGKRSNSRETRPNSDGPGIEQGWLPPLSAIERIEVIRGPMSSLYGSDAMGGVINIVTRKVADHWLGSLRGEVTLQEDSRSGDEYRAHAYLAGPLVEGTLGLQAWGLTSRRQEDDIEHGFNRQRTDSATIKLGLAINERHDLLMETSENRQNRTSTPGRSAALLTSTGAPNTVSASDYDQRHLGLTHLGRWGWASSHSYLQRDRFDNPVRDMHLENTEFNSQWSVPLSRHLLGVGVQHVQERLEDGGNQYVPERDQLSRNQWALFAEDEWMLTDRFALTAGLRMTRDEYYGNHWTPRIYGVWHAGGGLTVKAGVSSGFKAPGLRQATADWGQITGGRGGVPAIIMGNPDLKPERSVNQELGLVWSGQGGRSASLTLFNTDFRDKISESRICTDPDGQPSCHVLPGDEGYKYISERINVDRARIRGVEVTADTLVRDFIHVSANYTWTQSHQRSGVFAGQPLNKMPEHMANVTVDWSARDWMNVWARVNFRSHTSDYLSRTQMAEGTPSWAFVDAGLSHRFSEHVSAGLGVYNLLDRRVSYEDYNEVHDGRRYWAQMSVSF